MDFADYIFTFLFQNTKELIKELLEVVNLRAGRVISFIFSYINFIKIQLSFLKLYNRSHILLYFQAQGVAWFGMSVTGIMAHFCAIGFTGVDAHFGSLLRITLYKMYFSSGSCEPDDIPVIDLAALSTLDLMTPTHVFIWMWVFMLISLLWIASSITMITSKRGDILNKGRWIDNFRISFFQTLKNRR